MKKVLALLVAVVLILSISVNSLAAGFVISPPSNPAPELIEGGSSSEDCEGSIKVVPYSEREKLPENERKEFEDAYNSISNSDDLTDLNDDLKDIAKDNNIKGTNLSVSDLFALTLENCPDHTGHGDFNLKLSADTLKNFVGLLRFDGKNWHLVKGASAKDNILSFTTEELGSFAIVVDSGAVDTPKTGESNKIYFWIMVFAASAIVLVVIGFKKKKV